MLAAAANARTAYNSIRIKETGNDLSTLTGLEADLTTLESIVKIKGSNYVRRIDQLLKKGNRGIITIVFSDYCTPYYHSKHFFTQKHCE